MTDLKKLLQSAQEAAERGGNMEWTATDVRVGRVQFGSVRTEGREDTLDFMEAVRVAVQETKDEVSQDGLEIPDETGSLLSVEIGAYLGDLSRRKLAKDTISEAAHSLRLLREIIGDMPVRAIKGSHIREFWDGVRWWPAHASVKPEYRELSVKDAIARGKAEDSPMPSDHTFNKHQQRLAAFFNSLVSSDVIPRSPLKGLGPEIDTDTEMETGRPFTPDELRLIFNPLTYNAWARKYPHRWWGPMLGLYSGARVTEVAQLRAEDIQEIKGVWGFFTVKAGNNNKRGKGTMKIKSKSSLRFIPLAEPLLAAGFLKFLDDIKASGHPRLFPHLPAGTIGKGKPNAGKPNGAGYGRQLSRQFGKYLEGLGVEKGVAFHAFRHTLSTGLAEADVDITTIAKVTGHAQTQQVPTLQNHYIHIADPHSLPARVAALAQFKPPVSLPTYTPGQFAKALADSAALHP